MRFIFYLPNLKHYLDRVYLVDQIAKKSERGILVTSLMDVPLDSLEIKSVEILKVPGGKRLLGPFCRASQLVKQVLKQETFQIVHDTFGHLWPLFKKKKAFPRTQFLTSVYNYAYYDFKTFWLPNYGWGAHFRHRDLRNALLRIPIQKTICTLADQVILQAPALKNRILMQMPELRTKLNFIPNSFEPSLLTKRGNREPHPQFIRLLYLGRFSKSKGCDQILELLCLAKEKKVGLQVRACGGVSSMDSDFFRQSIKKSRLENHLNILPEVRGAALEKEWEEADWLIHPTLIDGSPRVILEALARGLPVIATRHPGITILDPDEDFILFSGRQDTDKILDTLLEEKRKPEKYETRSQKGQNHIHQNFNNLKMSQKYLDLYHALAASPEIKKGEN